jgi:hypothetical protein
MGNLNVSFESRTETLALDYLEVGGAEMLVKDEEKAKWPAHWRAFTLGLPLQPEAGVPRFFKKPLSRTIEEICIKVPGTRDVIKRELRPSDLVEFKAEYEAWKAGKPVGTPLATLTPAERAELEINEETIRILASGWADTVENVATLTDGNVRGLLGGLALRERAQKFLAKRAAEAIPSRIQAALDALSARLTALEQRMEKTP